VSEESIPVTVQILDKDYRIACAPGEEQGLMDCARMLDKRMREVRQNGRVIGADRIAVMAALNVIYELMQKGSAAASERERLVRLQERIAAAGGGGDATSGVDAPV
jgi:cell division protein ZapA